MGTDINGFIECRAPAWLPDERREWRAAIDLELLNDDRDYDAFGCLFGVRNFAGFQPLAAGRGLPDDVSATVRAAAARWDFHSATWISWAEVAAVDWDELAEYADQRLHKYKRLADGSLVYEGKSSWSQQLREATGVSLKEAMAGQVSWVAGQEFVTGDLVFRAEVLRRRDAVPPDCNWQFVWRVMETLADRGGPDSVRLVAWFD